MSHPNTTYGNFEKFAGHIGHAGLSVMFRALPANHSGYIENRTKFCAKLLASDLSIKRSAALEAIAKSFRYAHWHDFSCALNQLSNATPHEVPSSLIEGLKDTLILYIDPSAESSLTQPELTALEAFADRLSAIVGVSATRVLDAVCAGCCGEKTWSDVKARTPMSAKLPLYSFRLFGGSPKSGGFVESQACRQLIKQLDSVYQGTAGAPELEAKAKEWIIATLRAQPGFLEAGLALAQLYYDEDDLNAAMVTLKGFLKQANKLIPTGFRGRIDWGHIENRVYHRMIWLEMTIYHEADWMRECLAAARKQLRLNPRDNLGVRDIYPLMLLECHDYEKANDAAKYPKEGGLNQALVQAFCKFAINDYQGFVRCLATSLFDVPMIRLFLMDDLQEIPDRNDWYRGCQPDMDTFARYAWPAYIAVPGLRKACTDFLADPIVKHAEAELSRYWKGFWRQFEKAEGDYHGYGAMKVNLTHSIVEHFESKYRT